MRPLQVLAATAAALVLLAGCSTGTNAVDVNNGGQFRFVEATPQGKVIPVADRSSAPQFGGSLLDGSAFDSAGLVGKVAVINFWGQWCAPCRVETPEFQRVYADVRDRGVSFLGINVKDNDQLASAYLRNAGIEYPSVFDPRGEVALAFRNFPPAAIPSTVLLDRRGRVAAVYLGPVSEDTLRAALDLLLGEG